MTNQEILRPDVREWSVATQAATMTFLGRLLGRGTTETDMHRGHAEGEHAQRGQRCSACRWYECTIYEIDNDGEQMKFLVHTQGDTRVPGESLIPRAMFSTTATGVVDLLVQKQPLARPDPYDRETWTWSKPRLSRSARMALEQASVFNDEIRQAIANWNGGRETST